MSATGHLGLSCAQGLIEGRLDLARERRDDTVLGPAKIISHEIMGAASDLRRLILETQAASEAKPGQFLHIRITGSLDPLLRRPLSIAGIDRDLQQLTVYYRIKGRGTQMLAEIPAGKALDILGPLGNGFSLPEKGELTLIAGGIGVFPLMSLAEEALGHGIKTNLLWGAENKNFIEDAGLQLWQQMGVVPQLATMDGSIGCRGLVTDLLQAVWTNKEAKGEKELSLAACGPMGMLKAVSVWAKDKAVPLEVSLEEKMGCGLGACLGCICKGHNENGKDPVKNLKICTDGPVFKAEEVAWDAC